MGERHGEEGAVAVEMAVILSALIFLIFGVVQFALVFWNWNTMLLAVEEAGRYAMLYNPTNYPSGPPAAACPTPVTNCDGITNAVVANCAVAWANQNYGNLYTLTCASGTAADGKTPTLTFTATYTFTFLTSFSLSRGILVPLT
jgi:Flp pilus assembly protein TadG